MKEIITLAHGSGGEEMQRLISRLKIRNRGRWKAFDDDGAVLRIGDKSLVFTTDSYTVDPIFFPGGDIGYLSVCGTVNDLLMMGARPAGISLSFIIEEGFPMESLMKISSSINELSEKYDVPIVTGDTKVMDKGKIDKIVVNTAGVGLSDLPFSGEIDPGDKVIISGGIGEHAVALLSKRFNYETSLLSDAKPLLAEMDSIRDMIKYAKDPTRGGIAATLNEISTRYKIGIVADEEKIPLRKEVKKLSEMLGVEPYELACEGRFVAVAEPRYADAIVKKLKVFNKLAAVIGEITAGDKVVIQTKVGKSILRMPSGRIVPRIC